MRAHAAPTRCSVAFASSSRATSSRAARSRTRVPRRRAAGMAAPSRRRLPANCVAAHFEALHERAEHARPARTWRSSEPQKNEWSQRKRLLFAFSRNSNATPRKMSPSSMTRIGKYIAGMMIANASGNAANRPMPPSTSHVSLPSQIGATEFMISVARRLVRRRTANSMPTPRSKPSSSTYMKTASAEDAGPDRNEVDGITGRRHRPSGTDSPLGGASAAGSIVRRGQRPRRTPRRCSGSGGASRSQDRRARA